MIPFVLEKPGRVFSLPSYEVFEKSWLEIVLETCAVYFLYRTIKNDLGILVFQYVCLNMTNIMIFHFDDRKSEIA